MEAAESSDENDEEEEDDIPSGAEGVQRIAAGEGDDDDVSDIE